MSMDVKVTLLGTCGGVPIPGRAQTGLLVESEDTKVLFDCGMAVPLRLREAGVDADEIDCIFLTHKHLDHVQDLPSLTKASWLICDEAEYDIFCPPEMVDWLPELWKSTDEWGRVDLEIEGVDSGGMKNVGRLEIRAFDTPHRPESQGYVINDKIVFTGDTAPNEKMREIADGAELLIHELSLPIKTDLHTTPEELVELLDGVEVGKLVITHFYPQIVLNLENVKEDIERKTGIETVVGEDLIEFRS